jgi:DNA (cytosine-5)-methyltransferase 1
MHPTPNPIPLPERVPNGLRVVDLCCKGGGASMGYYLAGYDVIGVDREPQAEYPFPFVQADLRDLTPEWLRERADVAAASPPCWAHSDLAHRTGRTYEDFIPETRALLAASGLPYVIENVEGAPLLDPVTLCGTQFPGLRVLRHRLFESNVPLSAPRPHGQHPLVFTHDRRKAHFGKLNQDTAFVQVTGGGNCTVANARAAMGIHWLGKDGLNQAIPPAYTEHLGRQVHAHLSARVPA